MRILEKHPTSAINHTTQEAAKDVGAQLIFVKSQIDRFVKTLEGATQKDTEITIGRLGLVMKGLHETVERNMTASADPAVQKLLADWKKLAVNLQTLAKDNPQRTPFLHEFENNEFFTQIKTLTDQIAKEVDKRIAENRRRFPDIGQLLKQAA